MASAITSEGGGHDFRTSTLEPRISASQESWSRFQHALGSEYPEFACSSPLKVERRTGKWMVTETVCVWLGFKPALMPLCDAVKIIAPRELVAQPDFPAPGIAYLPTELLLALEPSPVFRRLTIRLEGISFEYLRFEPKRGADLAELLEIAGPDYPRPLNLR